MTTTVNVEYARKNEGYYYGEGTASLSQRVARSIKGAKRAKTQAARVHEAVREVCKRHGMNPDIETFMRDEGNFIRVSWESGPYEWAIVASDALCQVGVFAEPYYSFDLCFYPSEDRA